MSEVFPITTPTETARKAAAQKAVATRRRNEAKRSQSAKRAAETRARAQMSSLRRAALQAERAADTALGAVLSAWGSVRDIVTRARAPSRELERAREGVDDQIQRAERRGGAARKRAQRDLKRRRGEAQSTTEDTLRRAEERVRSLTGSDSR